MIFGGNVPDSICNKLYVPFVVWCNICINIMISETVKFLADRTNVTVALLVQCCVCLSVVCLSVCDVMYCG